RQKKRRQSSRTPKGRRALSGVRRLVGAFGRRLVAVEPCQWTAFQMSNDASRHSPSSGLFCSWAFLIGVGALLGLVLCGCSSAPKSREVLLRRDGQDRHWIVRRHGVVVEEHYLTAHGDIPV